MEGSDARKVSYNAPSNVRVLNVVCQALYITFGDTRIVEQHRICKTTINQKQRVLQEVY